MKRIALFLALLVVMTTLCLTAPAAKPQPATQAAPDDALEKALAASVMVEAAGSYGTGVAVRNAGHSFIWTDAHVVDGCKHVRTVIDPKKGQPVVRVTFKDVSVVQSTNKNGRKTGETRRLASIIRFSTAHDIAVLRVHDAWPEKGSSFLAGDTLPKVGAAVWHVGGFQGPRGEGSVSDGVVAALGRLRRDFTADDHDSPLVYDQVSITAHPGSSGGGVFLKEGGACIGLVTEFLGPSRTYGALCITPARRLREFAASASCLWALDGATAVPERDDAPVEQDDFPVPADFPGAARPEPAPPGVIIIPGK